MIYKMQKVIDAVLGAGYLVVAHSESGFGIKGMDGTDMSMESVHDLKSHWREGISKAIHLIVEGRVKTALNEN